MGESVWVLGASMTKISRYPDKDVIDLAAEATDLEAIRQRALSCGRSRRRSGACQQTTGSERGGEESRSPSVSWRRGARAGAGWPSHHAGRTTEGRSRSGILQNRSSATHELERNCACTLAPRVTKD